MGVYNQPNVVTVYSLMTIFLCCLLVDIFMYMNPIGLILAYRELCKGLTLSEENFTVEWMSPLTGFRGPHKDHRSGSAGLRFLPQTYGERPYIRRQSC